MIIKDFAEKINASVVTNETNILKRVSGIYACDLLSWVMSHACRGDAWITVHTNLNIVAVALLAEISCIIVPEGIKIDEATTIRAVQEGIVILSTPLNTYQICSIAHDLKIGAGSQQKEQ